MKRLLFIFNPHTGGGRLETELMGILQQMAAAGYELTVYPTGAPGDAKRAAAEKGAEYDHVVCCGGDGTLNEVVHGLMQLEAPPTLGYIPGGTTNDFASSLDLPKADMQEAAERALFPTEVFRCDVGKCNDRVFTYVAAFGAFTDVSYSTPQSFKNLLGYLAYILEGIAKLPQLHAYNVTVTAGDTVVEKEDILFGMVSNSTSVGGFSFLPVDKVHMDDGLFEVLLIHRPQNLADLTGLSAALLRRDADSPYIESLQASEVTITSETPIPWTLDGEFGGEMTETNIQVCPQAIKICI